MHDARAVRVASAGALMAMAIGSAVRGYSYLPVARPKMLPGALDLISEYTGITFWAVMWLVSSALCLVGLIKRCDIRFLAFTMGLTLCWGGSYLISYALSYFYPGEASREYLNAVTYLGPAALLFVVVWAIQKIHDLMWQVNELKVQLSGNETQKDT